MDERDRVLVVSPRLDRIGRTPVKRAHKHLEVFVGAFDGSPAYTIETGGYDQNTISLVHVSVLPTVRPFLEGGDRKLGLWFERQGRGHVHWDGPKSDFYNVNAPQDLRQLESEAKTGALRR